MEEIEFSRWLLEGRLRQCKNVLPDGLNWLCYFAGSSKSLRENSIPFIFLESPHQVGMKNVVKCWKDFLYYFTTLETYCVKLLIDNIFTERLSWKLPLALTTHGKLLEANCCNARLMSIHLEGSDGLICTPLFTNLLHSLEHFQGYLTCQN